MKKITKSEKYLIYANLCLTIFILGMTANFLVMSANHGLMPVKANYINEDSSHFSYSNNSEVNHWYFSDIIKTGNILWSIGDLTLISGIILYTMCMLFFLIPKLSNWRCKK